MWNHLKIVVVEAWDGTVKRMLIRDGRLSNYACVRLGLRIAVASFCLFACLFSERTFFPGKCLFCSVPSPFPEPHIQGLFFLPDHPEHVKYGEIWAETAPQRTELGKHCDIAKQHHREAGWKLGSVRGLARTFYDEPSGWSTVMTTHYCSLFKAANSRLIMLTPPPCEPNLAFKIFH